MIKEWDNRFDNICSEGTGQVGSVSQKPQQYFRNKSFCSSAFPLDNVLCLFLYCCFELCSYKNNIYCNGTLYFCQTFQPKISKHHAKLLILMMFPFVMLCYPTNRLCYAHDSSGYVDH